MHGVKLWIVQKMDKLPTSPIILCIVMYSVSVKVNKEGPYFVYVEQIYKHEFFDIDSFDRFRIACVHRQSKVFVVQVLPIQSQFLVCISYSLGV